MYKTYYVSKQGSDRDCGSECAPFLTINKAAQVARPGDTVIVGEGVYREWVDPKYAGLSDSERITYEAAPGTRPVIKGSEVVTNWKNEGGDVWSVSVDNALFGDYNPFAKILDGDWLLYPEDKVLHTGCVYLDGVSLYEAASLDEVRAPQRREIGFNPPWSLTTEYIPDPERTTKVWFAEVGHDSTVIYANFGGADPNEHLTEINVRKCCFYPSSQGINYITLRGFEIAQCATIWAPPTGDQPGMVGPHWSKGWIIEDNILHDARCSAISLGKDWTTGDNECSNWRRKPGYQYQMEAVFRALPMGWSKEKVGSHIVRNNVIYDCGQNGIVGHMGAAFSSIYHNHIYNIGTLHEYFGHEIAGIKLHAAIDVQIFENNIHNCTLGTWLDWQAQGSRTYRNVYHHNNRDFFIEVTHGPSLVDHNIFASEYNFDNAAQGTAWVSNLCCGNTRRITVLDRATPYHFAHTTQVAGVALVYSGDDRWYGNIFTGSGKIGAEDSFCGTCGYSGSPVSLDEYKERVDELGRGDHENFNKVTQPAYIANNAYFNGATSFDREENAYMGSTDPKAQIVEKNGEWFLEIYLPEDFEAHKTNIETTHTLGHTRISECRYDDPNGNVIVLDTDLLGDKKCASPIAGPIASLKAGKNYIKVW